MKWINCRWKILYLLFLSFFLISSINAADTNANITNYFTDNWYPTDHSAKEAAGTSSYRLAVIGPGDYYAKIEDQFSGNIGQFNLNGGRLIMNNGCIGKGIGGTGVVDPKTWDEDSQPANLYISKSFTGSQFDIRFCSIVNYSPLNYDLDGSELGFDSVNTITIGGIVEAGEDWCDENLTYRNGTISGTYDGWFRFDKTDSALTFSNIFFPSDPYSDCSGAVGNVAGMLNFDPKCKFNGGLKLPLNLIYRSIYPLNGILDFNDKQLTLENTDIYLDSGGSINGNGTIVGDGNSIIFNSNQTYENILSFSASSATIDGKGYELDLNNAGRFTVEAGKTLKLKNMVLKNLRSDWKSGAGSVVLDHNNMTIIL